MNELNQPLLKKIADAIEGEPERWYQSEYACWTSTEEEFPFLYVIPDEIETCGTAFCVAGWAIELSVGYHSEVLRHSDESFLSPNIPAGTSVTGYASKILDLTEREAQALFHPHSFRSPGSDSYDPALCISVLLDLSEGAPFDDNMFKRIRGTMFTLRP